jgi:hypothetical protein
MASYPVTFCAFISVSRNSFYFSYYSKYMNLSHNHLLQIYVLFLYTYGKTNESGKRSVFNETEKHYLFIVYFGGEEIDETYSFQTPPG